MASDVSDLERQAQEATSSLAQERIIRNELLMQKPDEIIVQLPAVEEIRLSNTEPSPTPTPWQAWRELLF